MARENDDERTEAATVFRREEFRKQGTVALSRELVGVLIVAAVLIALKASSTLCLDQFHAMAERFFKIAPRFDLDKMRLMELALSTLSSLAWMTFPVLVTALVAAFVVCLVQVGWTVSWEPLSPNWDRLNPVHGFQRIFSSRGLMEALKASIKLVLGGFLLWWFVSRQSGTLTLFYSKTIGEGTVITLGILFDFVLACIGVFLIPGGFDYLYQKIQLEKQMRMTRREAKDELKLREGDPLIRSRIKSLQRKMATRRMMESIPSADVVITNPTHLAVALQYDAKKMASPKVVAKGAGFIAEKIREIARNHGIPIVENKPLARILFRKIEVNRFIPRELYKAVAEVLGYVYRLRGLQVAS